MPDSRHVEVIRTCGRILANELVKQHAGYGVTAGVTCEERLQ